MSVDDSRTLTHADATSIAAELPNPGSPAPGAGALPLPRNTLEAMSFVAFARQEGVSSFWARSPNADAVEAAARSGLVMPWITESGENLVFRRGERRCILLTSGYGPRATGAMHAVFRECDGKLASGIVTVAAAAAPPPPPGDNRMHWWDPVRNPPPPPSAKRHAYDLFARTEVRPRTRGALRRRARGRRAPRALRGD